MLKKVCSEDKKDTYAFTENKWLSIKCEPMNMIHVSWFKTQLWPLLNVAMNESLEIETKTV